MISGISPYPTPLATAPYGFALGVRRALRQGSGNDPPDRSSAAFGLQGQMRPSLTGGCRHVVADAARGSRFLRWSGACKGRGAGYVSLGRDRLPCGRDVREGPVRTSAVAPPGAVGWRAAHRGQRGRGAGVTGAGVSGLANHIAAATDMAGAAHYRLSENTFRREIVRFPAVIGGGGEIRTPAGLAPRTVFETAAFDRSATPPRLPKG